MEVSHLRELYPHSSNKHSLPEQAKVGIYTQSWYRSSSLTLRIFVGKEVATTASSVLTCHTKYRTTPLNTTLRRTTPCRRICRSEIWRQVMGESPTSSSRRRPHTSVRHHHLRQRHRTTAAGRSTARLPQTTSAPTSTSPSKFEEDLCLLLPGARFDAGAGAAVACPAVDSKMSSFGCAAS